MQTALLEEARRQAQICNACRYCEGYCAVFPAMHAKRAFSDGDLTQFANLCHNCRGCYYACQYTEPHEFALNLPRALAEVRQDSWKSCAWPAGFAQLFDKAGLAIVSALILSFALLIGLIQAVEPSDGAGFYAYLSHGLMVAIFAPAFVLPGLAVALSLRAYWRQVGGGSVRWSDVSSALSSAARMQNLSGGHGEGCNFEDEDRFSQARRHFHQATLWGFLMCFAATSSGTVLHYVFDMQAPYGFFSLPKLLGVPGGILLCLGTAGLAWLKTKADPSLGAPSAWGGEMAFVLLLFAVSATGLALYAATGTSAVAPLLAVHLATVLTLFLLTPYTKMMHGAFRLAALIHDAALRRGSGQS